MSLNYDVMVRTLPTPNPSAIKFIVNAPLKATGKATFYKKEDGEGLPLVESLFVLPEVLQVHIFENVMTVTFLESAINTDELSEQVTSVIKTRLPVHDPAFKMPDEKEMKKIRDNLSPEMLQIEEILDRTIRPGLQADGGDLEVLSYANNTLIINYQGACGTCPSSMYGTLDAIQSILQEEFNPELRVEIG